MHSSPAFTSTLTMNATSAVPPSRSVARIPIEDLNPLPKVWVSKDWSLKRIASRMIAFLLSMVNLSARDPATKGKGKEF